MEKIGFVCVLLVFGIAALLIQSSAAEEDDCFITLEYDPVCSSDGVTYSNRGSFACAQKKAEKEKKSLTIKSNGTCEELQPAA